MERFKVRISDKGRDKDLGVIWADDEHHAVHKAMLICKKHKHSGQVSISPLGKNEFSSASDMGNRVWTCPRCSKKVAGYPATSRRDNHTFICSSCGTDEAMFDFAGGKIPHSQTMVSEERAWLDTLTKQLEKQAKEEEENERV